MNEQLIAETESYIQSEFLFPEVERRFNSLLSALRAADERVNHWRYGTGVDPHCPRCSGTGIVKGYGYTDDCVTASSCDCYKTFQWWLSKDELSMVALRAADEREKELQAKLDEYEIRQVGLQAELAGLKSKGPFILDDTNPHLIYCEDEGVYLNPSSVQGVADKLNAMQAKLDAAKMVICKHIDTMRNQDVNSDIADVALDKLEKALDALEEK